MSQEEKAQTLDEARAGLLPKLKGVKISDLKLANRSVVLDVETDPKKAIEILLKNKVRAAPVQEKNKFIGVLDLRDTVKFALESYKKGKDQKKKDEDKSKALQWLAMSPQITTQTLKYLSRMRQFKLIKNSDSVVALMHLFAKGFHIVGVTNDDDKLLTIVSQGQLFQEIYKLWGKKIVVSCPLSEFKAAKYISSPVQIIKNSAKAYDAFEKMSTCNLSGLAVVNDKGKIIHNTSATDIKLWLIASNTLEETIEQFLINIRKLSLSEKYPITVCSLEDTFGRGLAKLQATKYHRLWIVDAEGRPVGVLALTDIYRFLVDPSKEKKDEEKSNE